MTATEFYNAMAEMLADERIGLTLQVGDYANTARGTYDKDFVVGLNATGISMRFRAPMAAWTDAVSAAYDGYQKLDVAGFLPPRKTAEED